jgi:hypothetical protein
MHLTLVFSCTLTDAGATNTVFAHSPLNGARFAFQASAPTVKAITDKFSAPPFNVDFVRHKLALKYNGESYIVTDSSHRLTDCSFSIVGVNTAPPALDNQSHLQDSDSDGEERVRQPPKSNNRQRAVESGDRESLRG